MKVPEWGQRIEAVDRVSKTLEQISEDVKGVPRYRSDVKRYADIKGYPEPVIGIFIGRDKIKVGQTDYDLKESCWGFNTEEEKEVWWVLLENSELLVNIAYVLPEDVLPWDKEEEDGRQEGTG